MIVHLFEFFKGKAAYMINNGTLMGTLWVFVFSLVSFGNVIRMVKFPMRWYVVAPNLNELVYRLVVIGWLYSFFYLINIFTALVAPESRQNPSNSSLGIFVVVSLFFVMVYFVSVILFYLSLDSYIFVSHYFMLLVFY